MFKKKTIWHGLSALMLSLIMTVAVLPDAASAAEDVDSLKLNKTAALQEDGTYTIKLEAYATGEVKTTTVTEVVPTDIVLVLDQSGSMTSETIDGIPAGYKKANPNHGEAMSGTYYYESNGSYYQISVTKELISAETKWVGQDGKVYADDELSYSWKRRSDGQEYTTATPFVTSSLKTFTRTHSGTKYAPGAFQYVNDDDKDDKSQASDWIGSHTGAAGGRYYFEQKYKSDSTTVEFHNDGAPSNKYGVDEDDPYYVAAVYTAVTKQTVYTYEYTYTYTDVTGKVIEIGKYRGTDSNYPDVTLYVTGGTTSGTRLQALQYAAQTFINSVRQNALAYSVGHRVAIVGFASDEQNGRNDSNYYSNTELFIGATQYNYAESGRLSTFNTRGNLASDHYKDAFQNTLTTTGYNNLVASVNALAGSGATHPRLGFEMANGVFEENSNTYTKADGTVGERKRIVIFLTDGEPGDYGYESGEASLTITASNTTKNNYNAKVYTVAVLGKNDTPQEGDDIDTFLKNVSSDGTYTLATEVSALTEFFDTIKSEISNTEVAVTLNEQAVLSDVLGDHFTLPSDFSAENNITVRTAPHVGYESFGKASDVKPAGVKVTITNNVINVTGFNYTSPENVVTTDASGGSVNANGNKLIVTITGVEAKDSAATGSLVSTNAASSGIYNPDENGNVVLVKAFEQPMFKLTKELFVIDYAKPTTLGVTNFAEASRLDSADDLIFSKVQADAVSLTNTYGNTTVSEGKIVYTPKTMQWNGYDTFYALGKTNAVYNWAKVSAIPANNVYYEDDFITNNSTGMVGIEYTGNWVTDGENSGNTEEANNPVYGWIDSRQDDTRYSDGSAHKADVTTGTATATFTFTGRGVDVYSRTDMTTGTVLVSLKGANENGEKVSKYLIVDNYAASAGEGAYYQIPTVFFNGLEYGTYTVTIKVTTAAEGRYTYYLDGIRIYNPLSDQAEQEDPVREAYGEEANATFITLRDHLIDKNSFTQGNLGTGVLFIDQITDASGNDTVGSTTKDVGVYKVSGPKNEIYLSKGQSIAFAVGTEVNNYIGLKGPEGTASVKFTNGANVSEVPNLSAADSYYKIVPSEDGIVCIENTGDTLLAITKLRTTGEKGVEELSDSVAILSYANVFDNLEVVEYLPEDDNKDSSDDVSDNTPSGDIVIENPEEPENPDPEFSMSLLEKLFRIIRGWFRP